jgi:hypothetical protein
MLREAWNDEKKELFSRLAKKSLFQSSVILPIYPKQYNENPSLFGLSFKRTALLPQVFSSPCKFPLLCIT